MLDGLHPLRWQPRDGLKYRATRDHHSSKPSDTDAISFDHNFLNAPLSVNSSSIFTLPCTIDNLTELSVERTGSQSTPVHMSPGEVTATRRRRSSATKKLDKLLID